MSRWLFFPSPAVSTISVGTATGWDQYNPTITRALGWSSGTAGTGIFRLDLRSDSYGGFFWFPSGTTRDAWMSSYSGYKTRITDASANVYEFTGTYLNFGGVYIQMSLTGWSGTLPTISTSNATTIELYT